MRIERLYGLVIDIEKKWKTLYQYTLDTLYQYYSVWYMKTGEKIIKVFFKLQLQEIVIMT